jgi:serine/threonine protein kinase
MPTSQPDNLLAGKYELTDQKREGGMATVVRAIDIDSKRSVAIKRMKLRSDDRKQKESMRREIEALQSLKHSNIVECLDVGQDDNGAWFLVLEWLERNLHDYVLENGPLTWRQFADRFGYPLLKGVDFAQKRKLVHRDIKPRNILLSDDDVPKLSDYGISKFVNNADAWSPVEGATFTYDRTPGFSPPEPDDYVHSYSRDCFSIAAVSIFCLTGVPLDTDEQLRTVLQETPLPPAVRPLIERCLSLRADERPVMGTVMLADLERIEVADDRARASISTIHLDLTGRAITKIQRLLDLSKRRISPSR